VVAPTHWAANSASRWGAALTRRGERAGRLTELLRASHCLSTLSPAGAAARRLRLTSLAQRFVPLAATKPVDCGCGICSSCVTAENPSCIERSALGKRSPTRSGARGTSRLDGSRRPGACRPAAPRLLLGSAPGARAPGGPGASRDIDAPDARRTRSTEDGTLPLQSDEVYPGTGKCARTVRGDLPRRSTMRETKQVPNKERVLARVLAEDKRRVTEGATTYHSMHVGT
jgi:hypothetical protein